MKIKIYTEGGSGIGLGHISRCSSLYDIAVSRGIEVEFIIYGNVEHVELLKGRSIRNDNWLSKDYLENDVHITDYCIVDSYLASESLYEIISSKSKRALFIDDNARIQYPKGIIVNPSLSTDTIRYPRSNDNIYLLGFKYIILRSPFINVGRNSINKTVKEVLITMGGSDIRDLTPKILTQICVNYPDIKFSIVVCNTFHNLKEIERIQANNIELYYNIEAELMRELMMKSDFTITAAGQTIYELLATETPFIPIKIVNNQSNNVEGLRKVNPNQVVIDHDDTCFIKTLQKEFVKMLKQVEREKLLLWYQDRVDGLGSKRIVQSLLGE